MAVSQSPVTVSLSSFVAPRALVNPPTKTGPPSLPPVIATTFQTTASTNKMASEASVDLPRRPTRAPARILSEAGHWDDDEDDDDEAPKSSEVAPKPRRARASIKSMAVYDESSESSQTGSVSDGDPPGWTGGAPPPNPFERRVSAASSKGQREGSEAVQKRQFDELEDIVFSNPASFKAMVHAIAESRGVTIRVADDRTHKVTSAYMHITCDYRGSGCPFMLKLTKNKEGGWIMKTNKSPDVDVKQRSNYRCRHPAGAKPDPEGGPVKPATSSTTSHPGPSGSKPKAAKPRVSTDQQKEPASGKAASSLSNKPAPPASKPTPAPGVASVKGAFKKKPAPSPTEGDRGTLAPPYARSVSLATQLSPALASTSGPTRPHASTSAPRYPPSMMSLPPPFPTPPVMPALGPPAPVYTNIAPAYRAAVRPDSLERWRRVLHLLDPELVPVAEILASPQVDAAPASFFAESSRLQQALIDTLDLPSWMKVKLKAKMLENGSTVWNEVAFGKKAAHSAPPPPPPSPPSLPYPASSSSKAAPSASTNSPVERHEAMDQDVVQNGAAHEVESDKGKGRSVEDQVAPSPVVDAGSGPQLSTSLATATD